MRILGIPTKSERRRWQLYRIKYALRTEFPDGASRNLTDKEMNAVSIQFLRENLGNVLQLTLSPVPGAGESSADTQIRK